jgi:hypothetical protein
MKKLPEQYFIYETSYGTDIPVCQLFLHTFDEVPSIYKQHDKIYKSQVKDYFLSIGYVALTELTTSNKRRGQKTNTEMLLFNYGNKTGILLKSKQEKEETLFDVEFYYTLSQGPFDVNFDSNKISAFEFELKKRGINLVKAEHGHLDTEEYEMNIPDIDIKLNYGEKFVKLHETIISRLNKNNDKGIVLFHGDPGTGKTSYIKYLTRLITEKEILFIPPSMAESLSEPSIIPFLMEHKNSILIIEDAEKVISDRSSNGSSVGVSNILNITDGILGDCLNIQIIATFNMKKEKIDQALLRKGRLICEHKFEALTVEESNELLKSLGKEKTVEKPTTLADIYNIDEDVVRVENKNQIGFKN